MITALTRRFAQPHSRLYDLGCSRGAGLLAMGKAITREQQCTLVGVDQSKSMLSACRKDLQCFGINEQNIELIHRDIRKVEITDASVVLLNFTLQFLPVTDRLQLLTRVREGLRPNGVLLLSEKVLLTEPKIDELCVELHHSFKRQQGYSELEINRKREALIDVLIPEKIQTHQLRLREAGFATSEIWCQVFNFCSFIAIV